MALLKVRALPGRVAFDAPRGGKRIPSDAFVPVKDTPHIRRLVNHWGDIEIEGEAAVEPTAIPAVVPEKPVEVEAPPPPPPAEQTAEL